MHKRIIVFKIIKQAKVSHNTGETHFGVAYQSD